MMNIINYILANYQMIISAIVGILTGLIAIALIIPGSQPEEALQKAVDFLKKLSNK